MIGRTAAAGDVKAGARSRAASRDWTTEEFIAACTRSDRPAVADVAHRMLDWMARDGATPSFGYGTGGPMYVQLPMPDGSTVAPFDLSTGGRVEALFSVLRAVPPFDQPAARHALKDKLNAIPGIALLDEPVERGTWPSFDAVHLAGPEGFGRFAATLEWIGERLARGTLRE